MCAQENTTLPLVYAQYPWGDRIEGTKAELQGLGIGVGLAFPGEDGANKIEMITRDPRGYRVKVCLADRDRLTATLTFPNWPESPSRIGPEVEAFPGVTRQEFYAYGDRYIGTAQALVAAGLVKADQFPGMPGMFKTRVTVYSDGSISTCTNSSDWSRRREPGARSIQRDKRGLYSVIIHVPQEVKDERREAHGQAEAAWIAAVARMDRPARLLDLDILSRQRGRVVDFAPTRSAQVVSLSAWRESRRSSDPLQVRTAMIEPQEAIPPVAAIVPPWAREAYTGALRWHDDEAPLWRCIGFFRLYGATTEGMRDAWRYIERTNPKPQDHRRILANLILALDVAPELVLPDSEVHIESERDRRPPENFRVRDSRNVLARRLVRNLRAIRFVAPSDCLVRSQDMMFMLETEHLATAFDIEPDRLPRGNTIYRNLDITHHRWTHLGWRQHRRAVDVLGGRIVRDARDLAERAPRHFARLERLALLTESLPDMDEEHAGWIELEPRATYLLWARNVDHLVYLDNELPQCSPRYLRWADFASIASALFTTEQVGHNAPELIGKSIRHQRAAHPNLDTFPDSRQGRARL